MYILKRIIKLDYKKFIKIINLASKKSHKSKLYIFLDIIWCGIKYQAGYMDYNLFAMYELKNKDRANLITRGFNNKIVKKYNNTAYSHLFNNKIEFNTKFKKYLNREWLELDDYESFAKFIGKGKEIIVKPVNLSCGKGIEKIQVNESNCQEIFDYLKTNKLLLIEEVIVQNNSLSKLYPYAINSIRVVTLNHHIAVAYLRIGNHKNVVDNFNHGGMAACIDIDSGIVNTQAVDKDSNLFLLHPMTNEEILNFKIPYWEELSKLCIKLSYEVPELGYVGWDIGVGNNKLYLIEGNEFPGHDIYELPVHRIKNIGHKKEFLKLMD